MSHKRCHFCQEAIQLIHCYDSPQDGIAFNIYACDGCGAICKNNVWKNKGDEWIAGDRKIGACGNCKYFGEELSVLVEGKVKSEMMPTGFHKCDLIRHYRENYTKQNEDGSEEIDPPPEPAHTVDASQYRSALRVRSDFGCILFEERK